MPNPFLEGAPYTQMMRILEFAAEYHIIKGSESSPCSWLDIPHEHAIDKLEDAFFDSCVATQSCVVKAIALIYLFDGYPEERVNGFLKRANAQSQAPFIKDALDKLSDTVTSA